MTLIMRRMVMGLVTLSILGVVALASVPVHGEGEAARASGGAAQEGLTIRGVVPLLARDTYGPPEEYLQSGPQSTFSEANQDLLIQEIAPSDIPLIQAGNVVGWVRSRFTAEPSGGTTIGKTDVNGLMATRVVTGCHDQALLVSAALRFFHIPALMADSAGIQWAEDFRAGRTQAAIGHVFVEAFIDGGWVLIECGSGRFAPDYDTSNPVIPLALGPETKGFYILYKGLDPASYGVTDSEILGQTFRLFAQGLSTAELVFPTYQWQFLPGQGP